MQQPQRTARKWAFTSFQENLQPTIDKIKYAIYQREVAPDTGREHWQGFVVLKNPARMTGVKTVIGDPACHLEMCNGTDEQNIAYCSKVESRKPGTEPVEIGERKSLGQGSRSDLNAVVDKISDGATLDEIGEEHGVEFIKYHRGISALIGLKRKHRDPSIDPEIFIYWGESGTGKTRRALQENPGAYVMSKPNKDGNVWFDNYQGEKVVIFDEFYSWLPFDMLLRLCDRYPLQVPIKGGFVKMEATRFVFTSNQDPREWYSNVEEKLRAAWERRVREWGQITHFANLEARDVN